MARKIVLSILLILFFNTLAVGADRKAIPKPSEVKPSSEIKPKEGAGSEEVKSGAPDEKLSVTQHSIHLQGRTINYTATAGRLTIADESGKPEANIFFVAYVVKDAEEPNKRPITFAFNGGPGASSVWLHIGAIGPKRATVEDSGRSMPPPYQLVDNEYTWLTFTDLVFIDPVGTGFSRPASGVKEDHFHGIKGDIQSIGDFIRLYTSKFDRWLSPKFMVGESYGTFRAVGLSRYLFDSYGMDFNGLVLISPAVDFQTFSFGSGNDLPYLLALPSYTAAAWYWKKLNPGLQGQGLDKTLKEAEEWAMKDYVRVLAKGSSLSESERKEAMGKLALYTGLSDSYIDNNDLRISTGDFRSELLKSENLVLGQLDSRASRSARAGGSYSDPGLASTIGPYVGAMNQYVRSELDYQSSLPYIFLSSEANRKWDWGSAGSGYPSEMDTMRDAMSRSTQMKVFMACGYYDLATPYFTGDYTVAHLGLSADLQKNIGLKHYDGGHQMYTNLQSLRKLTEDVAAFETEGRVQGQ